jgi:Flp pilus assembly pilin Flp
MKMLAKVLRFLKKSDGAALVEYALIASLIAIAAIAVMTNLGGTIKNKLGQVHETLSNAGPDGPGS